MATERPFWGGRVVKPTYSPQIDRQYTGTIAGGFKHTPLGVILHGSRSGVAGKSIDAEYLSTARYAASGIELGWTATVGNDRIALHTGFQSWGWNARESSSVYLACEFAQANVGDAISDEQVRTFVWFVQEAKKAWPLMPMYFPTHAELPAGIRDGKSDVFPLGSSRALELRGRIRAQL